MSLQLNEILYQSVIKITYFYSLVLGMLPGSYDWKTHQFSIKKSYLFYSGFIQLSFLSIIPLTSSFMHEKNNYMNNKPILQWSYMVGKCAMVTTVVVISLKIWQRRQGFIELCEIYERFVKRYENIFLHFRQHIIGEDFGKQEKRLKRFVIYKFISLHVHTLAVSSMYFQMQKNPDLEFVIMITVNMLQGFYLLTANMQFMLVLCHITLHFSFINYSLEALQQQRLPLNDLLKFYLVLYEMHLKCLKMSRLFFNASNTVTFFMLLKIFTSNIILLYHAVLTIMSSIPSTTISNFVGLICVVNFYWDSLLVTAAIDLVLVSAHRAMEILQGTWIIWKPEEDVDIFKKLTQLLFYKMSLQLRDITHKFIIKITYYYSLILGISPGIYDYSKNTFKLTKLYLLYSVIIQVIFLGITPLTSPYVEQENNFMENKPILQWTYLVGKVARILTIVVISGKIWMARQNLIQIYELYRTFLLKYQQFIKHFSCYITYDLEKEDKRMQQLLLYKFLTLHLNSLVIQGMFIQMQEKPGRAYFIMVSLNLLQTFYLLVANLQFIVILCEIHLRFYFINKSLEAIQSKRFPYYLNLQYYLHFYNMYGECYTLSKLCFKVCNDVTFFMLIKIFTTNIVILYHAALVLMSQIRSDNFVSLFGTLCIVNFYWDSFLNTVAIDKVLTSSSRTAEVLRETWITKDEVGDLQIYKKLTQVLNQFSDYLACNKLKFCIFGLVNFDKASSFSYFVAALLHLIILVQFD
ncbi:hypothetical protein FF38_09882 [Lucilia cuprina]|uniref:Gustatory receptor n=1 Tax=Lucilia cuprina TaxID=7375 RepID=A0A0L0CMC0_LUCCU|nr:hypothetical protein FF38_09882 [Lucilia cuprina]